MSSKEKRQKTILFPHRPASGGPGTFQTHFEKVATANGWQIVTGIGNLFKADVVFVVAGTKKIGLLILAKLFRIPIIHRLDGINWHYQLSGKSLKVKIVERIRNGIMRSIRKLFANTVVYQSQYVQSLWTRTYGTITKKEVIIYNGTDLDQFIPKDRTPCNTGFKILCVEGVVQPDINFIRIFERLHECFVEKGLIQSFDIIGKVSSEYKQKFVHIPSVQFRGSIPRDAMAASYRNADLFFCLELNPPCPNSVVEALASGLPVVSFKTGALPELVGEAGSLALYPNELAQSRSMPEIEKLIEAFQEVFDNYDEKAEEARMRAEHLFFREKMVDLYVNEINQLL